MALVRCFYEEDYDEPTGLLYLETQSKRVEWDGITLKVGRREIRTHEYFEEHLKQTGTGYMGGSTDAKIVSGCQTLLAFIQQEDMQKVMDTADAIRDAAVNAAAESIQVAAMCQKIGRTICDDAPL